MEPPVGLIYRPIVHSALLLMVSFKTICLRGLIVQNIDLELPYQ